MPPSLVLWLTLAGWTISFFLPASRETETYRGWEAAYTALALLFLPVKGAYLGWEPHVFSVTANFFMLWAPFEIRAVKQGRGRVFTVLFLIVTAVSVGLAFLPSPGIAGIRSLLAGYYLWTFSLVAAAGWFSWAVWRKQSALTPCTLYAFALLFKLLYHLWLRLISVS